MCSKVQEPPAAGIAASVLVDHPISAQLPGDVRASAVVRASGRCNHGETGTGRITRSHSQILFGRGEPTSHLGKYGFRVVQEPIVVISDNGLSEISEISPLLCLVFGGLNHKFKFTSRGRLKIATQPGKPIAYKR